MQNTFVLKYGGTSVGTTDRIKNIANQLVKRKEQGHNIVVVVSAMGKTTDELVRLSKEISEAPCKRDMDVLLSTGEQVSIALLSMAIKEMGYDAVSLTGYQAGIETCDTHSKARINRIREERILTHLREDKIVVVAGFQGISENGDITTLGRGGSDTTAVSIAAVLGCPCEIYTDVDGVYSVDPRIYPEAKKLTAISYDEMLEMASTGAGILETRAIEMGHKYKVPIYIALSTGEFPGTYIKEFDQSMEKKVVTGMTIEENCLMVSISMVPFKSENISRIFAKLAENNILVDMISQTAPHNDYVSVSFTTLKDDQEALVTILDELGSEIEGIKVYTDDSLVKLSVVGIGMISQSGVAATLFDLLANNNIDFLQVTTSEISISYTIHQTDMDKAVHVIAEAFDL